MLVLSRKKNQSIVIGPGITVKVLDIKGSTIRIGIDAPQDVSIRRSELRLLEAKKAPAGA